MGATYSTPMTTTTIPGAPSETTEAELARELLQRAHDLTPFIREHANRAEADRRLPKPIHEALTAAGFQRLMTPRSLGGLEADPVTCARVVEAVALADSAAGWALQGPNVNIWWAARLPDDGVEELYGSNPSVPAAAAFHPQQRAVEVAGGYRVTGRSPLASGIHDSEWVLFSAFMMDGDAPRMGPAGPVVIAFILPVSEVEIIDTWHTLGMRGTDSADGAFNDVFVPARRTFILNPEFQPGGHFAGPLYRLPATLIISLFTSAVQLATARNAITAFKDLAARKTPFGSMKTVRDRAVAQATVAEAEAMLRSARAFFYETTAEAWARTASGNPNTLEHRADQMAAAIHAAKSAATVTDMMHRLAGTTGIYQRSPLERHFRDAHTLRHHGFASESKLESVGQIYLGLPPDFPLIVF